MSNEDDQTSSTRQQSEGPPNTDDDFSLATTQPFSAATSDSIVSINPKRHRQISWLLYWASITPVICGGLGPTLTLMAISGCADQWRAKHLSDGTIISERDPSWVIGITTTAIVVGFIANIFLLMRMLGRANPKYMQYTSIVLWTLESIMNFTTIGIYVQKVGDDGDWAYAQGFWMTICSACMSSICAFLLSLNSFILPAFGKRGKMGLSGPQRVFVIQVMIFIFWLAVGAAIFYGVEEFTFSESVYFVDVTVTTVGFGDDVVPKSTLGQALVMPYAIVGIILLGLVIASIRTVVVERGHIRKKLINALMKKHQKRLDHLKKRIRRRHAGMFGVSMMIMGNQSKEIHDRSVEPYIQMIEREELEKTELEAAEKWKEHTALALAIASFSVFWLVGGAIFSELEGWTYFEGLYFCMMFFLTIGYGDFVVTTNAGRAIYIVYSLFTIPIITIMISLLSDTFLAQFRKGAEQWGIKGNEDQRFLEGQHLCEERTPRWKKVTRKLFRRRVQKSRSEILEEQPTPMETDIEQGLDVSKVDDDILREEVLEEVKSIQESVAETVDSQLGIGKDQFQNIDQEGSSSDVHRVHKRRRKAKDVEDNDDEEIREEDVDIAIKESRRHS